MTAVEVLQSVYTIETTQEKENAHYFLVQLDGVKDSSKLNSYDEVVDYLAQNVPVPYSPDFVWGKEITNRIKREGYSIDAAPDLLRFMSIKIGGKKAVSYYNFLRGILDEEDSKSLPVFSDMQIGFAGYLSAMLPLVRPHEYLIIRSILDSPHTIKEINNVLSAEIKEYDYEQLMHAIEYMIASGYVLNADGTVSLRTTIDSDFREYIDDLLKYGLTRYGADYGAETGFKLWQSYRMDQVQLKLLKNPGYTMKGTYVYDGDVIIFASIKKDASIQEHLNYKDKFLQPDLFQWECEAGLSADKQAELINSRKAFVFIRKVESENGIVMPFTYVGEGVMRNPRKTDNPKGTLLDSPNNVMNIFIFPALFK